MMKVKLVTLDQNGDPTETHEFMTVNEAIAWATKDRGEPLEEQDCPRGSYVELMTAEEADEVEDMGEYPAKYYYVEGIEEDGSPRELLKEDWGA